MKNNVKYNIFESSIKNIFYKIFYKVLKNIRLLVINNCMLLITVILVINIR